MTSGPVGDVDYLRKEAIELNLNIALKEAILADLEPVRFYVPYSLFLKFCLILFFLLCDIFFELCID